MIAINQIVPDVRCRKRQTPFLIELVYSVSTYLFQKCTIKAHLLT